MEYPVTLIKDDNGSLLVTCPDLPEVTSFGKDEADALRRGRDAVEEALAARMDDFSPMPHPSAGEPRVRVRLPMAMKVELYRSLEASGMTRADLMRALGWHRNQVDRLFDPRHATRLDQFEAAFGAMRFRAEVRVEAA
jgi:antitoxin HicB